MILDWSSFLAGARRAGLSDGEIVRRAERMGVVFDRTLLCRLRAGKNKHVRYETGCAIEAVVKAHISEQLSS